LFGKYLGISGNERADAPAKAALSSSLSNAMKCPATDFYHNLAIHCQRLWQAEWDGCILSSPVLAIVTSPTLTAEMLLSSEGSALVTPASHISTFSVEKNHHNATPVIVH